MQKGKQGMKGKIILSAAILALGLQTAVTASSSAADAKTDKKIRDQIHKSFGEAPVSSIKHTPLPGIYEVVIDNAIYFTNEDGRYMFMGRDGVSMLELGDTVRNLSSESLSKANLAAINSIDEKDMIVYGPEDPKYTITVFTDVNCGYCRKLHREMQNYTDLGIQVRYMAFPAYGGQKSFDTMVDIWCSKDRQQALTDAKSGKKIPRKLCNNAVSEQYALGKKLGFRGTPGIILEDGRKLPGYKSADAIYEIYTN